MTTPRLPHDDLAAAMAARRELGSEYDDAFAETVVARLQEAMAAQRPPAPAVRPSAEASDHSLALTIVSLLATIPLSAIGVVNAGLPGLFVVWIGVVLINVTFHLRPRR